MADDPQQTNPTPSSPQNTPKKPGGMDGVDISELAKRVETLSAELERITHETDPETSQADTTTQLPSATSPTQPSPTPTTPPQPSPEVSASGANVPQANTTPSVAQPVTPPKAQEPEHTASISPSSQAASPNAPNNAPSDTPAGASREGVNLSSLKQRVLESSTFGSRVQPATEEPFDPLDLAERPQQSADTASQTPSPAPQPPENQNAPSAPEQAPGISENVPAETLAPQQPQQPPQPIEDTNRASTSPTTPTPEQSVRASSDVPRNLPQTPTEQPAQESHVSESPVSQTAAPEPRPTEPAHEFFDTIEWHARNDADKEVKQNQTPPAPPQDQPTQLSDEVSTQAPASPQTLEPETVQEQHNEQQSQTPEQSPATGAQETPSPTPQTDTTPPAQELQQQPTTQSTPTQPQPIAPTPQPQSTTQTIPAQAQPAEPLPKASIPRGDFASLTGSEHSGVEFVQVTPDEQEPLASENQQARDALEEQRRSIDGVEARPPQQPTTTPPAVTLATTDERPQQPPVTSPPQTAPPQEAPQTSAGTLSPLTGQITPPEEEEPVPSTLKPIRTFQDDIAQRVQTRDTSIVSVASAEQDRQNEERKQKELEAKQKKQRGGESAGVGTYIKIGLSGLFIGVSIAGLAFFAYLFLQPSDAVVVDTLPEYIFSDEQTRVDVTGQSRREFMNTLLAEKEKVSLRLGAISYLYLTLTSRLPEGGERINLLSSTEFFERLEADVSGSLTRSIEPMMMFGVHVFDGNPPFLIFKVNFFENAFAGMLQWEDEMQVDLAPLFGPAILIPQRPSADTPPESIQPSSPNLGQFTDEIVRNKEVRVLRNANDRIVLLYGFIDRNTLVITTNEFTFAEIVTRHSSRRF